MASLLPTFAIDTLVIRFEYGLVVVKASSVFVEKVETELNTGELLDDDVDIPRGKPDSPSSLDGSYIAIYSWQILSSFWHLCILKDGSF